MGSSRSTRRNFRQDVRGRHAGVNPSDYQLVALAMQEPQYVRPRARALAAVAKAKAPCMSIMNMPPLTYLKRIPGIDATCRALYRSERWDAFDPRLMTLCSPDPQAFPAGRKGERPASEAADNFNRALRLRRAHLHPAAPGADIEASVSTESSCPQAQGA